MTGGVWDWIDTPDTSRRWTDAEHPTEGATPATPNCTHSDIWHQPGEWKYSCCACSGMPNGCDACREGPDD